MKKSTQELIDLMKSSTDYSDYKNSNYEELSKSCMKINKALNLLISDKGLKKSDVIAKSGIEVHYAYQILSGSKIPTRDKVVMLCFGLDLTVDETQNLLKITGYPQLYGKNERDNAILFGITKKMNMIDMNNLLYDLNLDLLI